jgi:hypothetical protein
MSTNALASETIDVSRLDRRFGCRLLGSRFRPSSDQKLFEEGSIA